MEFTRRTVSVGLLAFPLGATDAATHNAPWPQRLIRAARQQIGVTRYYDPSYVSLAYPGGDVPDDRGVCIDVIIRAYRDAFAFDFQQAIHEDMRSNFSAYPDRWGLRRPDRNIDHRRVPNMEIWLARHENERADLDWQPGDLMTCIVGGSLPHIAIVSDRRGWDGQYKVIHNIGAGAHEESLLGLYSNERRFRFQPSELS